MSRRLYLFPVLFLAACVGARPDENCAANASCAARAAEASILRQAQGRAVRRADALTLYPAQAAVLVFTDDDSGCDTGPAEHCYRYALVADAPVSHALVVTKFLYEGSETILIDSHTGRQLPLGGVPTFSPDGTMFLVAPFDLENDAGPNNLELWRREGDGAVLDWSHPWKQEYAEDPALPLVYVTHVTGWQPDHIALKFFMESDPSEHWDGTLTHDKGGWHLAAKSPEGLFPNRK